LPATAVIGDGWPDRLHYQPAVPTLTPAPAFATTSVYKGVDSGSHSRHDR
jgi:hypothetical protein